MKNILVFLLLSQTALAQTLSSHLSKNKIDLGEPITMKIHARNLQGKEVITAPKNSLLPFSFEEYKDDTSQNKEEYTRQIEFTIYEEGKHLLPALEFKIGDSIYKTIPYEIEVINPTQKGEEINDIESNREVNLGLVDYWDLYKNYILAVLTIMGIIALIFLMMKRKKSAPVKKNPTLKTLKDLEQLSQKKYIETHEYKPFYTELITIVREYLSVHYHIPADVLLTEDLVDYLKQEQRFSNEEISLLEEIFSHADWVKFAKTIPSQELMEKDFHQIKNWIQSKHFNPKYNDE